MTSFEKKGITVKLYKEGMVVFAEEDMPFGELEEAVLKKFKTSKNFFKGAIPKVGFKGALLTEAETERLIKKISEILETEVAFWKDAEGFKETTEEKVKKAQSVDEILSEAIDIESDDEHTKFHKKTLRSGQLLKSEGNVVIIGDVNPGAEVVAKGNIFVMGSVKGIVHAGAEGNREAVVVALNLVPTQLRIADIITRAPDENVKANYIPEVAYIRDNRIFIEEFLQKRK